MAELLEIILLGGAALPPLLLPLPPVGRPQVKKQTMAVQSSTPPSSSFFHWLRAVLTCSTRGSRAAANRLLASQCGFAA